MIGLHVESAEWVKSALCAQVGGDLWFPAHGEITAPAKQVCAQCPVSTACLEYALARKESHGIYGGLTENERRRILRQRPTEEAAA